MPVPVIPAPIIGSIFEAVTALAKHVTAPLFSLIDKSKLTEQEKAELNAEAHKVEAAMVSAFLEAEARKVEAEAEMAKAQAEIQKAEVASTSLLARSWRPLGMYLFLFLIAWTYWGAPVLGLPAIPMPEFLMRVIEVAFVGLAGLRTSEKMLPKILSILANLRKGT